MKRADKKRARKRIRRHRDEVTPEDVAATLELPPEIAWDQERLEKERARWVGQLGGARTRRLTSLSEIMECPQRVLRLVPEEHVHVQAPMFWDRATGEFLIFKGRLSQLNKMGEAGVDTIDVTPAAEDWARSQLSGRLLRSNGVID